MFGEIISADRLSEPEEGLPAFRFDRQSCRLVSRAKKSKASFYAHVQIILGMLVSTATAASNRANERVGDGELWEPSLERHEELFGRPPRLATADAGFASAAHEQVARDRGVARVALPARGRVSAARQAQQRQRWFKQARRWRAGCEARISVLKRRHGLKRCRHRGLLGRERWVGWAVLANNPLVLARSVSPPKSGGGGK